MDGFVLEKQALEKAPTISHTRDAAVSVDLSTANKDGKIKEQLMLLEDAIEKKLLVDFLIKTPRKHTGRNNKIIKRFVLFFVFNQFCLQFFLK